MRKHTLWRFLFFFLCLWGRQAIAQNWQALIELGGLTPYPFCNTVQNGTAQVPPSAVNSTDYRTRFVLNDTFYVGNQFALEARVLNAEANGGINAFDPGIYLEGCSVDIGASLMGDMRALAFTSVYAGSSSRSNIVNLVQDFSYWRVIRYEIKNNIFTVSIDGQRLYTLPYSGKINFIEQIMVRFKGAGLLDWLKLYDKNNQLIWTEDFQDCNNMQPAPDLSTDLNFQVSADTSVCKDEPLQLAAQALSGATFSWTGPNGFSSNQPIIYLNAVNAKDTGWYRVSMTYQTCVTLTDSVHLGLNSTTFPATGFLGKDTTLCLGDSLRLGRAYPCAQYLWQDGSTDSIKIINKAGNYIAAIRIDNQIFIDTIKVQYYTLPVIYLGNDTTLCVGTTLNLNATLATAATYNWQDGSAAAIFKVQNPGLYHVMITDVCGNTTRDSIDINYYKTLHSLNLGKDTTLCPGETLILNAFDSAAVQYRWQDGSSNPTFLVNKAGIYAVTLTDACNNIITDSIEITYHNLIKPVDLGRDTILCPGETWTLNATDPAAIQYTWQDGTNNPIYTVQSAGLYNVKIGDACGNEYQDSIRVNYYKVLHNLELGHDTTLCPGQTLLLNAFDSAAVIYRWQDGSKNPTYLVNRPGSYIVYMADNCGNTATDIIQVKYYDVITAVNIGRDTTLCPGETILLDASNKAAKFYRWQNGSTDSTFLVSQPGTYTVQVTDNCGHTLSDAVRVEYFPVLQFLDLGKDTSLCPGSTITLNAYDIAAVTYHWQDGSTQPNFKVASPGIYSVTISDHCNNILNDSIQIAYYQLLTGVDVGPRDTILCVGENLILNATTTDAKDYMWQDGSNGATYTVNQPGIYQIQVNDYCGNSASDEIRVRYDDVPVPSNIVLDTIVCEGEVFRLNATTSNATYYQWQDGLNEPIYPVTKSGVYNVTVGNQCGERTYSTYIDMIYCGPCRTYVPNAFSPNGDGNNDTFMISSECNFTHYQLRIFNRWGVQVFGTINPDINWDGTLNNSLLPNGVYVWQLRYKADDGSEKTLSGDVLLMK